MQTRIKIIRPASETKIHREHGMYDSHEFMMPVQGNYSMSGIMDDRLSTINIHPHTDKYFSLKNENVN